MTKKVLFIHRLLYLIAVLPLCATFFYYLCKWNSLPSQTGIHFDSEGNFDVVASRIFGFYPHLIGGIIIIGISFAIHLIKKKSTGLKLDEKGEGLFKTELLLTLDFFLIMWTSYFTLWSISVSEQIPLPKNILGELLNAVSCLLSLGIAAMVVTYNRHKMKEEKKKWSLLENRFSPLEHRLCRIVSWLLAVGGVLTLIEVWGRLPGGDRYYDPDYDGLAYFANLGAYLDKRLLIIPSALIFVFLTVMEILGTRALKREDILRASLIDGIKLPTAVFTFAANIILLTEMKIGIVFVILYAIFIFVPVFKYFYSRRKKPSVQPADDAAAENE
ncbi:MAG: hypothetical protein IJ737_03995 [Ruminococcus sp.]|nr:hypothetical protein [Ruminococcus sp.]